MTLLRMMGLAIQVMTALGNADCDSFQEGPPVRQGNLNMIRGSFK